MELQRNGVIIINTKRKGQAGALRVNFSSNTEMLTPGIMPEFQKHLWLTP